jgi:hypothetical protein
MKNLLMNLGLVILSLGVIDVSAYWLLPDRYLIAFESYRKDPHPTEPGIAGWPKDYYVADADRGFDIGRSKSARHWVDGVAYPIWSNSLGCFDREHEDLTDYVYFAGDSFTWGYAPYEDKFGTLVEAASGVPVLKCGVEHTGQRHQFSKFVAIMERVPALPRAVFVFYFENDVANDYAHPHTTVINGWLTDMVSQDSEHNLIRHSREELEARQQEKLARLERWAKSRRLEVANTWYEVKAVAKQYSAVANVLYEIKKLLIRSADVNGSSGRDENASRNFYAIPYVQNGAFFYLENELAARNQEGLLAFKRYSTDKNVPLFVVLIPRRRQGFNPDWFAEMDTFLTQNDIRFIDLAQNFTERKLDPSEIYWQGDAHFNREGNQIVAGVLLEEFSEVFGRAPAP